MRLEHIYLILAVIGFIAPLVLLVPWIEVNGFALNPMVTLLNDNAVTKTITTDLLIAAIAGTVFIIAEGLRAKVSLWWLAVIGTYMVGFCFGLPLFLYLRERASVKAVA